MGVDRTLSLENVKHVLYATESVQLGWNNLNWLVGAGMANMGNTCYLNSVLQALFHVPAFVNWLISDENHSSECNNFSNCCIICVVKRTLQDSQQHEVPVIRPISVYKKLRILCKNLIPGRQEDAHEFLHCLLETMEKAYLNRFKNSSEFDLKTKETTPINQILGGYLHTTVKCLVCGHESTTLQHFQEILLDIRKVDSVSNALDIYFSREKIDNESYHCENCQKKVPATKQFFIEKAPFVLCLLLKRFSGSNIKMTKHIDFNERLELKKYFRNKQTVPLIYHLVSLVTHIGPSVNCGHYTAVGQTPSGDFYHFDDGMVRLIQQRALLRINAYILLYEIEKSLFA